ALGRDNRANGNAVNAQCCACKVGSMAVSKAIAWAAGAACYFAETFVRSASPVGRLNSKPASRPPRSSSGRHTPNVVLTSSV
ncbi:MAG: hypothetical protein OEL91_08965, partial [Burkholderiaceae bacterium]|nr:hypothetical protein [Burkholderiaceae bacterium]